jgi:putative two-component system response regulator
MGARAAPLRRSEMKPKKRVLLVDDSKTVLMMERAILSREYEISAATDGEEALEQIQLAPPDIVLLDLVMPRLDGMETLTRLRASPATRELPVIVVTTRGEAGRAQAARAAGCQDFVTKPIDGPHLLSRMRALLGD